MSRDRIGLGSVSRCVLSLSGLDRIVSQLLACECRSSSLDLSCLWASLLVSLGLWEGVSLSIVSGFESRDCATIMSNRSKPSAPLKLSPDLKSNRARVRLAELVGLAEMGLVLGAEFGITWEMVKAPKEGLKYRWTKKEIASRVFTILAQRGVTLAQLRDALVRIGCDNTLDLFPDGLGPIGSAPPVPPWTDPSSVVAVTPTTPTTTALVTPTTDYTAAAAAPDSAPAAAAVADAASSTLAVDTTALESAAHAPIDTEPREIAAVVAAAPEPISDASSTESAAQSSDASVTHDAAVKRVRDESTTTDEPDAKRPCTNDEATTQ